MLFLDRVTQAHNHKFENNINTIHNNNKNTTYNMKLSSVLLCLLNSAVTAETSTYNWMNTYYFQAKLAANPQAVPSSAGSQSTGTASFTIKQNGSVLMDIAWDIVGDDGPINSNNALLGIHIHSGDEYTNGPIVFGFCGQDPLPPFNGKCQQGWSHGSGQVATQYRYISFITSANSNDLLRVYFISHATSFHINIIYFKRKGL